MTLTRLAAPVACAAFLLAACGEEPVPAISNPHAIVVDGKPMTQAQFISKYCRDKISDKTCAAVRDAKAHDDANRPMPKGW